jgi:hypothetical protein
MRVFITMILALMMLPVDAQVTISGVNLPATLKAGDTELILNGGGVRRRFFMNMYVGGLYLQEKSSNASGIVAADRPMAVRLEIVSGMISSDNMSEAIRDGFQKSTNGNTRPLQTRIDEFIRVFSREEISRGNVFELVYVPGTGVQTYKNGRLQNTIEGLDFKRALFGIWLSDDPADSSLKRGMLGR